MLLSYPTSDLRSNKSAHSGHNSQDHHRQVRRLVCFCLLPRHVANASARDGAIMQYSMILNFLAISRVDDSSPCRISTREDRSHHVQKHRSIRSCAIHRLNCNNDKGQYTRVYFWSQRTEGLSDRCILDTNIVYLEC